MKILFSIGVTCCLVLSLFAFTANAADTRAATSSSCSLVNPPNSEITWRFDGNQVVWVTVENGNVLGVTATLSCDIFATPDTKSWVLLPYGKTDELKYDIFGNVPIGWRFTLSTISDAALIYGKAHWNPFKKNSMKKKNVLLGIIIGLTIIISGCQSDLNDTVQNVSSIETPINSVKKYVDENTYIDLDVIGLAKEIASPSTRATIDLDKVAKMKAAIYRFYSNVELKNGIYNCKLTSASEINVSLEVYTALLNNLNEINAAIQKAKEKGESINVPDVDEAYLNSLLK